MIGNCDYCSKELESSQTDTYELVVQPKRGIVGELDIACLDCYVNKIKKSEVEA